MEISEAMDASAGAMPMLAVYVQLLSRHASLLLAAFVALLFLLVVLSELSPVEDGAIRTSTAAAPTPGPRQHMQHSSVLSTGGAGGVADPPPGAAGRAPG